MGSTESRDSMRQGVEATGNQLRTVHEKITNTVQDHPALGPILVYTLIAIVIIVLFAWFVQMGRSYRERRRLLARAALAKKTKGTSK